MFRLLLLIIVCSFCNCAKKFNPDTTDRSVPMKMNTYSEHWAVIDSLEKEGLLRSALDKVNALSENFSQREVGQKVKSLLYQNKYLLQLEENGFENLLIRIEGEIEKTEGSTQAIFQSILGELYYLYLQRNMYRIQNRTPGDSEQTETPFQWSPEQFINRSNELFVESLNSAGVSPMPLDELGEIIVNYGEVDKRLCTSLYEFLSIRNLHHFTNRPVLLTEPVASFQFDDPVAFQPLNQFLNTEFSSVDESSYLYKAILLYQNLIRHYQISGNDLAKAYFDLERLKFSWNNHTGENKEHLYEESLKGAVADYSRSEILPLFQYELAQLYYVQGLQYADDFDPGMKGKMAAAFKILESAVKNSGNPEYMPLLDQLKQQIEAKQLELEIEQVQIPDEDFLIYVRFRNIEKVHFRLIRMTEEIASSLVNLKYEDQLPFLTGLSPLETWIHNLTTKDFNFHATELPLEGLSVGQYILLASDNPVFNKEDAITSYVVFHSSKIAYDVSQQGDNPTISVYDRKSGHPLPGAVVELHEERYSPSTRKVERLFINRITTNQDGFAQFAQGFSRNISVKVKYEEDLLDLGQAMHFGRYSTGEASRTHALLFTDRIIYRPGQTIHFNLLAVRYDQQDKPSILTNQNVDIRLVDPNSQEVQKFSFRTNNFGTAHGSFTAPASGLLGRFRVEAEVSGNRISKMIRVEEYKRPTFEVVIEEPSVSYRLGDRAMIDVSARMYAGVPLSGAQANYRVVRESFFPYYPFWRMIFPPRMHESKEIAHGSLELNGEGKAILSFDLEPDKDFKRELNPYFRFSIYVAVVDITGETHSTELGITASYQPFVLSVECPDQINLDIQKSITITALNSSNQALAVHGEVIWEKLKSPETWKRDKYWGATDTLIISEEEYERRFPHYSFGNGSLPNQWDVVSQAHTQRFGSEQNSIKCPAGLDAGVYRLTINAEDSLSNQATAVRYVTLFSIDSGSFPDSEMLIRTEAKPSYEPGEIFEVGLGSAFDGQMVLIEIFKKGKSKERIWQRLEPSAGVSIPVKEEDRGNFIVQLSAYRENRFIQEVITVAVPWSNKKLSVDWVTFRDRVKPGSIEEWQFTISGEEAGPVSAQAVLAMYDASLDALAGANVWEQSIFQTNYFSTRKQVFGFQSIPFIQLGLYRTRFPHEYKNPHALPFLDWFNLDDLIGYPLIQYMRDDAILKRSAGLPAPEVAEDAMMVPNTGEHQNPVMVDKEEEDSPAFEYSIRSNFDETVFFYPELRTDDEGRIVFSFKMNDALTRWKLLGFVHTPGLEHEFFEKILLSQKEVMATPVAPRFMRENDAIYFPVKVSNLSDREIEAHATLEILDPATDMILEGFLEDTEPHSLRLDEGESVSTRWKINVPAQFQGLIKYRVAVDAVQHADIVEDILPVLTNRVLVTESLAFDIQAGATKAINFKSFLDNQSESTENHKYTLEFTGQPLWMAIQALPYLMEQKSKCSEARFSRFFAHAIGTEIVRSNPILKDVFDRWRKFEPGVFQSQLQKNEDLKNVLLEETPWLLDAASEEAQKRMIALFFSENKMNQELNSDLRELGKMQLSNGGWPWFEGGRDSRFITQHILAGFGQLERLGVLQSILQVEEVNRMIVSALEYADQRFKEDYQTYHKEDNEYIDHIDLHYLYMRSFFPHHGDENVQKEKSHLISLIPVKWAQRSIYSQALATLVLFRNEIPGARDMLKSLMERSLENEELGIYWKQGPGYLWHDLSIEGQAMMIGLFEEMGADEQWTDKMKLWLIKHKQTSKWPTTKATAEAIYALIARKEEQGTTKGLSAHTSPPKLRIGGRTLSVPGSETATGYFRKDYGPGHISKDLGRLEITNSNDNLAWGGLYWQYFEDADKVTAFEGTPLKVRKSIYKEVNSDNGPLRISLGTGEVLSPGDKILVRLEIVTDRDMDFVHLKDSRGSGTEPINVLSQYKWQDRIGYYESTRDLATHFFIDYLPKGTHIFEYPLRVIHQGEYSMGICTLQSYYAPEFSSHSAGLKIEVRDPL